MTSYNCHKINLWSGWALSSFFKTISSGNFIFGHEWLTLSPSSFHLSHESFKNKEEWFRADMKKTFFPMRAVKQGRGLPRYVRTCPASEVCRTQVDQSLSRWVRPQTWPCWGRRSDQKPPGAPSHLSYSATLGCKNSPLAPNIPPFNFLDVGLTLPCLS